jgi:hypothetical protein
MQDTARGPLIPNPRALAAWKAIVRDDDPHTAGGYAAKSRAMGPTPSPRGAPFPDFQDRMCCVTAPQGMSDLRLRQVSALRVAVMV